MARKAAKPTKTELTPIERAFVACYSETLCGATAFKLATGRTEHAKQRAYDLLQRPQVREACDRAIDERSSHLRRQRVAVIEALTSFLSADVGECYDEEGNLLPLHEIPPQVRLAVAEVNHKSYDQGSSTRLRMIDKLGTAKLLANMLGMLRPTDEKEIERSNMADANDELTQRLEVLAKKRAAGPEPETENDQDQSLPESPPPGGTVIRLV